MGGAASLKQPPRIGKVCGDGFREEAMKGFQKAKCERIRQIPGVGFIGANKFRRFLVSFLIFDGIFWGFWGLHYSKMAN